MSRYQFPKIEEGTMMRLVFPERVQIDGIPNGSLVKFICHSPNEFVYSVIEYQRNASWTRHTVPPQYLVFDNSENISDVSESVEGMIMGLPFMMKRNEIEDMNYLRSNSRYKTEEDYRILMDAVRYYVQYFKLWDKKDRGFLK
jgi:hypothetical protein